MTLSTTNIIDSGLDIANKYLTKDYVISQYGSLVPFVKAPALYMCGANNTYQLGDGTTNSRSTLSSVTSVQKTNWKQVACSSRSTLAIDSDTSYLLGWGANTSGELGLGDSTARTTPTQVGTIGWQSVAISLDGYISAGIDTAGKLYIWGIGWGGLAVPSDKSPTQVGSDTNWRSVSCGSNHVLAIKTDGTLWGLGTNSVGQLGIGSTTGQTSIVQVGTDTNWMQVSCGREHTVAIKTDGTMWSWGKNFYACLGIGSSDWNLVVTSPTQIGADTNWKTVSAGYYFAIAIKNDSTMWLWGFSLTGQAGLMNPGTYDNVPTQRIAGTNWTFISAGYSESAGIKSDGTLWTWGRNNSGQLGIGNTTNTATPTQTTVGGNNWRFVDNNSALAAFSTGSGTQNDYAAYIDLYSDLLAAWNNTWYPNDGLTKAQAGKRHWDGNGRLEGRTLPTKSFSNATGFKIPFEGQQVDVADIFLDWNTFNNSSV